MAYNWKIPLYKIFTDKEDIEYVTKVIRRGYDWAIGPEILEFEKLLANYVGSKYCVSFNSGTSALHAALLAAKISKSDEIICPSFTFIATSNSSLMVNAKPKFVDIEKDNLGLNPNDIENNITKRTKAIMPVHYAGLPCKIEEITKLAKSKKLLLIEDAAESLGSHVNQKMIGTFGDMAIFSFAGNKVLTTGEGGAIVTNSKQYFERLKLIRSHGRSETSNYFSSINTPNYISLGYNWRMSSITAALAISQLHKLDKLIKLRRKNAHFISKKLNKFTSLKVPNEPTGHHHVFQLYSIILKTPKLRNELRKFLTKKQIMTKIFFQPVHQTNFYKKQVLKQKLNLQNSQFVSSRILTIPMYPGLKQDELIYLCDSISEFMEKNS